MILRRTDYRNAVGPSAVMPIANAARELAQAIQVRKLVRIHNDIVVAEAMELNEIKRHDFT